MIDLKKLNLEAVDSHKSLFCNKSSIIDYSDGDVEVEILKFLEKNIHSVNDYDIWESFIHNWETEYHFSWVRTNILAPFPFARTQTVLELGGGTGILTSYIAERVSSVVSIEGSMLRAKCISKRCEKFENVTTIVSNFEDIIFQQTLNNTFDVITLIGVLEYTNKYFARKNAINDLLIACQRLLKSDGCLIIAIENKLGLKYLLGWEEDHTGTPYYGIEDRYQEKNVITFSYQQLKKILNKTGFFYEKFLFPFPDYKKPRTILCPVDNLTINNEEQYLFHNLIHKISFKNYSGTPSPKVNVSQVLKVIIGESLLASLSNSFLVIAAKTENNIFQEGHCKNVAYYFSSGRKYKYANSIIFSSIGKEIFLQKRRMNRELQQNCDENNLLVLNEENEQTERVANGILLDSLIEQAFLKKDKNRFEYYLLQWIQYLNIEIKNHVHSEFDLMPFNIIVNEDETYVSIDKHEWKCFFSLSIAQVVARFFSLNKEYQTFFLATSIKTEFQRINEILKLLKLQCLSMEEMEELDKILSFTKTHITNNYFVTKYNDGSAINRDLFFNSKKLQRKVRRLIGVILSKFSH